jgi:hypothetical protein
MPPTTRRIFGANKYCAFHLLLARWLRHWAADRDYSYSTLGGTELRDVLSLSYIDPGLLAPATAFEREADRHEHATRTAMRLSSRAKVNVVRGNIFETSRPNDSPHICFVDLEGACEGADFPERFADLLQREVLREGDALFVTSYLGRNPGYERIFERYDGEFRVLGISDRAEKRRVYRRAHPSFTLFRALVRADLAGELELRCIGCIDYRDSSPMGLYGYTLGRGSTRLTSLVRDSPYFNLSHPAES